MDFVNYLPLDFGEYTPEQLAGEILKASNISLFWQNWLKNQQNFWNHQRNDWVFEYSAQGISLKNSTIPPFKRGIKIGNKVHNEILNDLVFKLAKNVSSDYAKVQLIDATAGLLNDTQSLLHLNLPLISFEVNPLISMLIFTDAQLKTQSPILKNRWEFKPCIFNKNEIKEIGQKRANIILYDPMFESLDHKTLPSKEMQALAHLEHIYPQTALTLEEWKYWFDDAQAIIVKRPNKSQYLLDQAPNYSIETKLLRWDIYTSKIKNII